METKARIKKFHYGFFMILSLSILISCESNEIKSDKKGVRPPDYGRESGIEYYFPDSGGVSTQMIIKGINLGTDTSYLTVTVNDKKAPIIGVDNDVIYAMVPVRADTGLVKLFVRKGPEPDEFTFEKPFKYIYTRNVTTFTGKDIVAERVDGSLADARTRRPWYITSDKDDVIFFLEEGRGDNKDGALRRIQNGQVETLYENNSGPFRSPVGLAFNPAQDTLYVAHWSSSSNPDNQRTNSAIMYCTRDGGFVNMKTLVEFEVAGTTSVVVHPVNGEIYFNSQSDGYIYKYTGGGKDKFSYERIFRINNATNTELRMLFSPDGNTLYYVVRNRHCIFKSTYDPQTRTLTTPELWVGAWDESGYENGVAGVARFNNPGAPVIDSDGIMYIPDKNTHVIRRITPEGEVSLHAGMPNDGGYKDGGPDFARFREPEAVTLLSDGAIYLTDRGTQTIRRVVVE